MTVSDNTIVAEGKGNLFKNFGRKGLNVSKKMAKNVLKFQHEPWKSVPTLVLHLHLEALKQLHQVCQKRIIYGQKTILGQIRVIIARKMEQKTKFYPSAPFEIFDLELRLENNLNDVSSFNNSIVNIEEIITFFKDKKS